MTNNEAYKFLGQVRGCDNRIKQLSRTIEALRYSLLPGAIRYDTDRVQTTPTNKTEELFARIDELETELAAEKDKQITAILTVEGAIRRMPECKEKVVLLQFYIGRISIQDIADGMGITVRHCYRMRRNAISMFCGMEQEGECDDRN